APDARRGGGGRVRAGAARGRHRPRQARGRHPRVRRARLAGGRAAPGGRVHSPAGRQGGDRMKVFSAKRLRSLLRKEWIQVRRDPMTLRLIIMLPIMQLFLFGYAINTNPKNLPTGLLSAEHSKYERTLITALQNTGYYDIRALPSEAAAEKALAEGEVLFVINIPANFDRLVDRGESPSVLVDADASDPLAVGNATAALAGITTALNRDLPPIRQAQPSRPPYPVHVHAR